MVKGLVSADRHSKHALCGFAEGVMQDRDVS